MQSTTRRRVMSAVISACVAVAILVPLSSGESASASVPSKSASSCTRSTAAHVDATPVPGVASDFDVSSFDGTKIRAHWFPNEAATPDNLMPTVLMGPGWGLAGDTDTSGAGILGAVSIGRLWRAGYNVLTWDPRGFGASGGTVEVDSPTHEGRDVQVLIDWIASLPGVQLDRRGDPRMGMAGGSYGGGIQLVVAAIDCRVDAIAPEIAWHSLSTSLYKGQTPKTGWSGILAGVTKGRKVDPHITSANASSTSGIVSPDDAAWFKSRGPGALVGRIRAPTLLVQGTVDTLFTLDEAITNYRILRAHNVPTAMMWYCGGHGVCLTDPGDAGHVADVTVAWLDLYVKRDRAASVPPQFEFVDQHGTRFTTAGYPQPNYSIVGTGQGTLAMTASGGSGPIHAAAGKLDPLFGLADPVTPAKADNAVDVSIDLGSSNRFVVGAPRLTLTYRGNVPKSVRPGRVFAQLVDDATGIVVGNQITPIPVTLDGKEHRVSLPLEAIAYSTAPGSHLTLQIVATTVAYAVPRLGGSVDFASIRVALPVVSGVTEQK